MTFVHPVCLLQANSNAVYDDDPANSEIYGKLYNWFAVNDNRGVCPEGFRIPSDTRSPIHEDTIKNLLNLETEIWFEEDVGLGINSSNKVFEDIGLKKHTRDY